MLLNKKSNVVSYGGILTALSFVCLFLTTSFPFSKLAFSFCASLIAGIMLIAYGYKVALIHYLAVCILSVLFVPNKAIALFYVIALGNYPIIRFLLDKMKYKFIKLLLKLIVFNIYIAIGFIFAIYVLNINIAESIPLWLIWLIMVLLFFVYDYIYMPFIKRIFNLINKR